MKRAGLAAEARARARAQRGPLTETPAPRCAPLPGTVRDYGQCEAVTTRGFQCRHHSTGWISHRTRRPLCTLHKEREADGFRFSEVSDYGTKGIR
jgi:hypothetical protein